MDESIDKIDKMLTDLKAFYTYLGKVIDNGYNNDINDLEYLHEIVDTFYSTDEPEDEVEEELENEYIDNESLVIRSRSSTSSSSNFSIDSEDIEEINSNDSVPVTDYFSQYMIQRKEYEASKNKSDSFLDNYYNNSVNKNKIIIFNNIENHDNKFKKFIKSSFIF